MTGPRTATVSEVRQAQAQMPFTQEELQAFTKTERRVLHMIHILKYDEPQITATLDVKPGTTRWHMSKIKQKISVIRTKRFENRTAEDVERHRGKALPDFTVQPPVEKPKKVRVPRPMTKSKQARVPTGAELEAALDKALPMTEHHAVPSFSFNQNPASSFSHKRFFVQEAPPIPVASSPLPPSFHPEKPMVIGIDMGIPQSLENQQRAFGSFKR